MKRLAVLAIIVLVITACETPLTQSQTPIPTQPAPTEPPATEVSPTVTATQIQGDTEILPNTPTPTSDATLEPAAVPISVLAACPPEAQAAAMRETQVPDWEALDLNACYNLTLTLDDDATYAGSAQITFRNDTGTELSDLVFRTFGNADIVYGGSLDITSAAVNDESVTPETFLSDDTGLRVPLPEPLAPDEMVVVTMDFGGEVPMGFESNETYGIFNRTDTEDGPVVTLANWYPLLATWQDGEWYATEVVGEGDAVVSDVALYRVDVTAPASWTVVGTGSIVNTTEADAGVIHTLVSGPAREFTLAASPAYELQETTVDGVRVAHWGLPAGEDAWQHTLDVAADSLRIFNHRFGPYPYTELEVAAIPMQNAAGVEYPGLALVGAGLYTSDNGRNFLPVATAHEVAHMWWYAVVGNDVLQDPWQDEALTTFSSFLYFEEEEPAQYEELVASYERTVEQFEEREGEGVVTKPLAEYRGQGDTYAVVVYLKGALFFSSLRDKLGDETFFGALQDYYSSYKYELAPPEALLNSFETACGCELDDVYEEWGITE